MANVLDQLLDLSNVAIAQCFVETAQPIESNPFKLAAKFDDKPVTPKPYGNKAMTARESIAVLMSAKQHGLTVGEGVKIPRTFMFDGKQIVIENGAARDARAGGWVDFIESRLNPSQGHFVFNPDGFRTLLKSWDCDELKKLGFSIDSGMI